MIAGRFQGNPGEFQGQLKNIFRRAPKDCVDIVLKLVWSIWESVKFPRHIAAGNKYEVLRAFMQFWGDLIVAPIYAMSPAEVPLVQCQETLENEKILGQCPSLNCFKPSSLLRNPNIAFAALMWRDFSGNDPTLVRREHVHAMDGGSVALDWWVETEVPEGAKILFIVSTFTGDAQRMSMLVVLAHQAEFLTASSNGDSSRCGAAGMCGFVISASAGPWQAPKALITLGYHSQVVRHDPVLRHATDHPRD